MKRTVWIILAMVLWAASAFGAEVTNLQIVQEGGRGVFTYDLSAEADEKEAEVAVTVTVAGKSYDMKDLHLEGDFGKTPTGKGKRITWNILQDFPKGLRADVDVEVTAGGGPQLANTIGMKFVLIPAGSFMMGEGSEMHQVTISKPFYMQTTEVTEGQWQRVMGNNPSRFKDCGGDCPVEQVSWNDAQEFIRKLNGLEGTDNYRLPTEAQWEYASRSGGKNEEWAGTSNGSSLGSYAWYNANSGSKTHPVARKQPNGLGLFDTSGNVWEWVQDWKGNDPAGSVTDPSGPSSGSSRVLRGGSWLDNARLCRSSRRYGYDPDLRYSSLGFRLLRTR